MSKRENQDRLFRGMQRTARQAAESEIEWRNRFQSLADANMRMLAAALQQQREWLKSLDGAEIAILRRELVCSIAELEKALSDVSTATKKVRE